MPPFGISFTTTHQHSQHASHQQSITHYLRCDLLTTRNKLTLWYHPLSKLYNCIVTDPKETTRNNHCAYFICTSSPHTVSESIKEQFIFSTIERKSFKQQHHGKAQQDHGKGFASNTKKTRVLAMDQFLLNRTIVTAFCNNSITPTTRASDDVPGVPHRKTKRPSTPSNQKQQQGIHSSPLK